MSKIIILIIVVFINISTSKYYTPFTPLSRSKNSISEFYEFGHDVILQSTNRTLMIGLSY